VIVARRAQSSARIQSLRKSLSTLYMQESGLAKVPKSRSDLGPSIIWKDAWRKPINSGESALRGTSAHKFETSKARRAKGPKEI
jgi:hypothetical protein